MEELSWLLDAMSEAKAFAGMLINTIVKTGKFSKSELLNLKMALCCYFKTVEQTLVDLCLLLARLYDGQSISLA